MVTCAITLRRTLRMKAIVVAILTQIERTLVVNALDLILNDSQTLHVHASPYPRYYNTLLTPDSDPSHRKIKDYPDHVGHVTDHVSLQVLWKLL